MVKLFNDPPKIKQVLLQHKWRNTKNYHRFSKREFEWECAYRHSLHTRMLNLNNHEKVASFICENIYIQREKIRWYFCGDHSINLHGVILKKSGSLCQFWTFKMKFISVRKSVKKVQKKTWRCSRINSFIAISRKKMRDQSKNGYIHSIPGTCIMENNIDVNWCPESKNLRSDKTTAKYMMVYRSHRPSVIHVSPGH